MGKKCKALQVLSERWPDQTTRILLHNCAVKDWDWLVRPVALQLLLEKWPDKTTQTLLTDRARVDGAAASVFGGQHSEFGRIVFLGNAKALIWPPPLNPREPISRDRIEQAAKKANIPIDKIDETVRSLSAHLGWDITKGSAG